MNTEERLQYIKDLQNASPLEITDKLIAAELFDAKSSQEVIDEVYKEFENGSDIKEKVLIPVFLSVADGLIEALPNTRQLRKKGLTATRIIQECEAFTYDSTQSNAFTPNAYVEYKNSREYNKEYATNERGKYNREEIQNQNAMDKYKAKKVKEANGSKNITDEYTGQKNITPYRKDSDKRRNDTKNDYQAEPDHIVPLKQVYDDLSGNYALDKNDIRIIANIDDNFAVTAAKINGEKLDKTNSEYVKIADIDDVTKANMIRMEKEAQKPLDGKTNDVVKNNLTGQGTMSSADKKQAIDDFKRTNDREPTADEKNKIYKQLQTKKSTDVYGQAAKNAGEQATNYAIGNVVMFAIKPIYYEFKDIFTNGLMEGVDASSGIEAFKIRFARIKNYMAENIVEFIGDNLVDFIKGFISSLIEGIISLFVGIFKQILKVIKEGIKVFMQSAKILFGKESASMTSAQKGDAIIKILGGTVIALAGIGIEALLNKIGIGEPWSVVLSTMLSGIASAIFMYLLDKIDLFSVKAEQRHLRIKEIFDERIKDVEQAKEAFDLNAIETLKDQRLKFDDLSNDVNIALENSNIDSVNSALYNMADFFRVELPYKSTAEFVSFFDQEAVLEI